jgi:hypothetical protein
MATNIRALTITGSVMAALTYGICAAFVALFPGSATSIGSEIVHINLFGIGRSVTREGAIKGGVLFTIFVALVCAASSWLYNRLTQSAATSL